jgi:CheY-like chemotaxis protein
LNFIVRGPWGEDDGKDAPACAGLLTADSANPIAAAGSGTTRSGDPTDADRTTGRSGPIGVRIQGKCGGAPPTGMTENNAFPSERLFLTLRLPDRPVAPAPPSLPEQPGGPVGPVSVDFSPAHLIGDCLRACAGPIRARGLTLVVTIESDVEPRVIGQPGLISEVLERLLAIALNDTARGSIEIGCAVISRLGTEIELAFWVRHHRAIGARDETALAAALAICQQRCEQMGARLERAESPERTGLLQLTALVQASGLRVLLAEDHPINRIVTTRILERMGHRVSAVSDGRQAVLAAQAQRPDLILMDLQMPLMDGLQATRHIRADEARTAADGIWRPRQTIVAMTAHMQDADREAGQAAGMDDYLTKPLDPACLTRIVQHLPRLPGATASSVFETILTAPADPVPLKDERPAPPSGGPTAADPDRPFDRDCLRRALGDDPALIAGIAALFEQQSRSAIGQLGAALRCGDIRSAEMAVHSLKGMLAMLGAIDALALAQRMESALLQRSPRQALRLLDALEQALAQVRQVLRAPAPG